MPHCPCPLKTAALENPKGIALIEPNRIYTFSELDQLVEQMVFQLFLTEVKEGSLVATLYNKSIELISLFFAVWRIGASLCPLNLRLPPSQIETYLKRLPPHLFISSFPLTVKNKAPPLSTLQSLFLFTSGSTALPKIAVLSLSQLIANAIPAIQILNLHPHHHYLLSLPLYHVGGIGILLRCYLAKAAVTLDEKDPDITHLSWVPTQLYRGLPNYKNLQCLLLGGAPIYTYPSDLPCFLSYGLTEMGSLTTVSYKPKEISCGHPLKGREISISAQGEILVKGDCLFDGYWKLDKLEKPQGWFETRDIGSYDPQKGLIICGRKDWQFISGGENIQPEEIEKVLLQMDSILEAVILPLKDPEFGQRPFAVIRSTKSSLNWEHFKGMLEEHLPKYKIPVSFLLLDEIPKLGVKPDRKRLSEIIQQV